MRLLSWLLSIAFCTIVLFNISSPVFAEGEKFSFLDKKIEMAKGYIDQAIAPVMVQYDRAKVWYQANNTRVIIVIPDLLSAHILDFFVVVFAILLSSIIVIRYLSH